MAGLVIAKQVKNCIVYTNGSLRIDNVKLSYPHLDVKYSKPDPKTGNTPDPKYTSVFLMEKKTHGEAYELIEEQIKLVEKEAKIKVAFDDWFMRDGDRTRKEENEGRWTINASEQRNVILRDVNGNLLRNVKGELVGVEHTNELKEIFYPGAIVSAMIRPWAQNNTHGKKINAGLIAVKFMKDGDRLGAEMMTDDGVWNEGDAPTRSDLDDDEEM